MGVQARITIDVSVTDSEALRAYALKRATESGMSEAEFAEGEVGKSKSGHIEYWLAWAFDAGTPEDCGFDIEQSRADITHIGHHNALQEV